MPGPHPIDSTRLAISPSIINGCAAAAADGVASGALFASYANAPSLAPSPGTAASWRLAPKWPNRLARLGLVRRGPARGRSARGNRPRQSARRRPLLHQTAQDLVGGQGGRARAGTIPSRRPSVYLFVRTRVATLRAPTASQQYVSELLGSCARSLCSPTLPCSGTNFLFFSDLK